MESLLIIDKNKRLLSQLQDLHLGHVPTNGDAYTIVLADIISVCTESTETNAVISYRLTQPSFWGGQCLKVTAVEELSIGVLQEGTSQLKPCVPDVIVDTNALLMVAI